MANKTINVDAIQLRHDTAANWASKNPVLAKGELGIEIDTRKFKFGDGIATFAALRYASGGAVEVKATAPTTTDIGYDMGTIWVNTATSRVYILFAVSTTATWVELPTVNGNIATATKLASAKKIALTGDATGETTFDGSADKTITVVLANSGATAGTYTKLTIDAKGRVTSATTLAAADIPTLTLSKISDAGTAASKTVGTAAGNVPVLDSSGKLDESVIPAVAISDVTEVASQAAMLALVAERGDIAVRSDENKSYILKQTPASTLANWVLLRTPTNAVLSVNGKTGAITLSTTDIAEGTNLYFTPARFNSSFAAKSVTELSDGAKVITTDDTLVLNCGNA